MTIARKSLKEWLRDLTVHLLLVEDKVKEDYIVEQGTSGIWTYRKWDSGIAECWGATTLTNGGVQEKVHTVNLPFTFSSTSYVVTQAINDCGAGYQYACSNFGIRTRSAGSFEANVKCNPNGTSTSYVCHFMVKGLWK